MNDVNLKSPDLTLVSSSNPRPARANASPLAEGSNATPEPTKAERLEARAEVQREKLNDAVSQLNDFVQTVQRDLQFEVNNELGQTIVRVVDQATQKVIRQIPDEVALRLAENLQQDEPLTLFNIEV